MLGDGFSELVSPHIMVIHLSGNDLTQRVGKSLIWKIIGDLQSLMSPFSWQAHSLFCIWYGELDVILGALTSHEKV